VQIIINEPWRGRSVVWDLTRDGFSRA
jgi:hypothetical protein